MSTRAYMAVVYLAFLEINIEAVESAACGERGTVSMYCSLHKRTRMIRRTPRLKLSALNASDISEQRRRPKKGNECEIKEGRRSSVEL